MRWYRFVLSDPEFRSALVNSLVVASCTAAVTLLLGTLAAFGLARTRSRLRGPLALLFFLPITLPGLFIGLSLLVFFVPHGHQALADDRRSSPTRSTCSRTSC